MKNTIELKNITKLFHSNNVRALDECNFTVQTGEIHVLLGENGAGKSTLMQIMAGFLKKDGGTISVDGKKINFFSPASALKAGIGMVAQKGKLIPHLKVWEDAVLGSENTALFAFYRRRAYKRAQKTARENGIDIDIDKYTDALNARERQLALVLALLLRRAKFLIFDEPASMLPDGDRARLWLLMRNLAAKNRAVILISHKIEEVFEVADKITVMRSGKERAVFEKGNFDRNKIVNLMFGGGQGGGRNAASPPLAGGGSGGEPVFTVRNLVCEDGEHPVLRNISFEVYSGEILGIAGLKMSGIETLELAITGFLPHTSGSITLAGRDIGGAGGVKSFRSAGGSYLSSGRLKINAHEWIASCDAALSLKDNLLIHSHKRLLKGNLLGKLGFFDSKKVKLWLASTLAASDIHSKSGVPADTLSGGMLRRLLGVREFIEGAKLVVLSEPVSGLDLQRRERFFNFLREKAGEGRAIILFFSDIDELLQTCGKVLVLQNGSCSGFFDLSVPAPDIKNKINRALVGSWE